MPQGPIPCGEAVARRSELWVAAAVILLLNWPLFFGGHTDSLAFLPSAIAAGQWWRLLTHPFVHVSWYHLLLDGVAFLVLYNGLRLTTRAERVAVVVASAAGSIIVAWLACPAITTLGLRGLSGIAHGLMAITAIEMIQTRADRNIGIITLAIVVMKSAIEAFTGTAVFTGLHFGLLGTPVAVCHAGGVLGGLVCAWTLRLRIQDNTVRTTLAPLSGRSFSETQT